MDQSLDEIISERKIGRRQNKQKPKNFGARAKLNNNKQQPQRQKQSRIKPNEGKVDARSKLIQKKRSKLLISDARELINQKLVAQGHDARELLFRKRDRDGLRRNKVVDARTRISGKQASRTRDINPAMLRREIINDRRGLQYSGRDEYYEDDDDMMEEDEPYSRVNPMSVRITTNNPLARVPPPRPKSLRITTTNYIAKKRWPSDESPPAPPPPPSSQRSRYRDDSPVYRSRSRSSPVSRSRKSYDKSYDKPYDSYTSKSKSQGLFQSLPSSAKPSSYKVVVSNLHESVTKEDISELFGEMGYVESCRVVPGGMAEVVYESHSDAERAVEEYNKRLLDGVAMQCRMVPVYRDSGLPKVMRGDAGVAPDVGLIHRALFKKQNMKLSESRPGLH